MMESQDSMGHGQRSQVAVIGSGIAGLTCAFLLGQRHDVTIYELQPTLGMDAHAVSVRQGGVETRVDVPMRVFFEGYYPLLTRLYAHLGIETEAINYAASFASLDGELYFRYDNLRCGPLRIPFLTWAGLTRAVAWRIGADALRFFAGLAHDLRGTGLADQTLGEYLTTRGLSSEFAELFLLPAYAGVCTCGYESLRRYPAATILRYLGSGLLTAGVRRARGGAGAIVRALSANAREIRCGVAVVGVERRGEQVEVHDASGEGRAFDHVVLATQANQSLRILRDASEEERSMLATFRYEASSVLLHTDPALAPRERAWWSPVNFLLEPGSAAPMATIRLNPVHPGLGPAPDVFQTWHPLRDPRPGTLLAETRFERPLVDASTLGAVATLTRLQRERHRRVWFCGAYAAPGIPLLESAATSAARVAQHLGCALPWERSTSQGCSGGDQARNVQPSERGGAR